MPINATYEYSEALKRVELAKTPADKIKALEGVLSAAPTHKGAESLRQEIKTKISKLKEKVDKERSKKSGGFSYSIKKEGAAQVVLVGLANSGKSWILRKFTNAKPEVADYEFTTKAPEVGVMDYEGVNIQLIELPAFFPGYAESERGPTFLGIARAADLVVIVIDGTKHCEYDLALVKGEFERSFMKLASIKNKDEDSKPCLVVVNKAIKSFKSPFPVCWVDDLKTAIWTKLELIWVRTKLPGKKADWPPISLEIGSTVKDLAGYVHKDFIERFRFARIWGKSVKHNAATVGLDHVLGEGDIVELHLK